QGGHGARCDMERHVVEDDVVTEALRDVIQIDTDIAGTFAGLYSGKRHRSASRFTVILRLCGMSHSSVPWGGQRSKALVRVCEICSGAASNDGVDGSLSTVRTANPTAQKAL